MAAEQEMEWQKGTLASNRDETAGMRDKELKMWNNKEGRRKAFLA